MPKKLIDYKLPMFIGFCVFILGLLLLPSYRYGISPDTTSYITIAEKYSHADFKNAINGYWGPLFSWLLSFSFLLNIDPLLFGRLILIISSSIIAILSYKILIVSTTNKIAVFGAAFSGFVALTWALSGPLTPDLLFALILLFIAYFCTGLLKKPTLKDNLTFGILGSFLYFAKPAGFFVFIGLWLTLVIYKHLKDKRIKNSLKQLWPSLVIFLAISLPFIILLSSKYHEPTISTSSSYNLSMIGPDSTGHPINTQIVSPPNSTAINAWEDISNVPVNPWSPTTSLADFKYFIGNIFSNFQELFEILWKFSLPLVVLAIYGFFTRSKNRNQASHKILLSMIAFIATAIYLSILFEPRYLIFIFIASVIGFCWYLNYSRKIKKYRSLVWIVCFFAVAITLYNQVDKLQTQASSGEIVHSDSLLMKQYIDSNSRVVGDRVETIYACYYTEAKCFGVVVPSENSKVKLTANSIDYLLVTEVNANKLANFGVDLTRIEGAGYLDQKLYKVNQ